MHTKQYRSWLSMIERSSVACLLESGHCDQKNQTSYLFHDPRAIISCYRARDVPTAIKQLSAALRAGYYVCGFLSFEAAYGIEPRMGTAPADDFPLVWMGVFDQPQTINHSIPFALSVSNLSRINNRYRIIPGKYSVSQRQYQDAVRTIKQLISRGDTYQVNYTFKQFFRFDGSALALYLALRTTQPVSYQGFVKTPGFSILSFSPELFFRQEEDRMLMRPMKGTAAPGATARTPPLNRDPKNQAENIMIVDMLRNDLGRICRNGSIAVPRLFTIERYPTLLQMTSSISGRLRPHIDLYDIFAGLFPCGSVTGAPKIRTMQIIRKLEPLPRRIYTGCLGFITPQGRSVFNVMIRTLLIRQGQAEFGIGSGITYPSSARAEYAECLLKKHFLEQASFQLIETMRWTRNGCPLIDLHMQRLLASARALGFRLQIPGIKKELFAVAREFNNSSPYKVRLLLFRHGAVSIESQQLPSPEHSCGTARIRFAVPIQNSTNLFLRHKTTQRRTYDTEHAQARQQGYFDVIFRNERGEITEGAVSNVFLRRGRTWITPPLTCGVLPGVFRRFFMEQHPGKVKEQIITAADLRAKNAALFCCNAVRGMIPVRIKR